MWVPTADDLKKMEDLYALGIDKQSIAYSLGVHPATLFERQAIMPEINESFKRGKARAYQILTSQLMSKVQGGNLAAIIFSLKARFQWRDSEPVTLNQYNENKTIAVTSFDLKKFQESVKEITDVDPFRDWSKQLEPKS